MPIAVMAYRSRVAGRLKLWWSKVAVSVAASDANGQAIAVQKSSQV